MQRNRSVPAFVHLLRGWITRPGLHPLRRVGLCGQLWTGAGLFTAGRPIVNILYPPGCRAILFASKKESLTILVGLFVVATFGTCAGSSPAGGFSRGFMLHGVISV